MRPSGTYGEIRAALMQQLQAEPMTIRAAAHRSQVGLDAARRTIANAVRSGTVRECGHVKPAKGTRWEAIYELVPEPEPDDDDPNRAGHGWVDLGRIVGGWAR